MTLNSASFGFCVLNNRTTAAATVGWGANNTGTGIGSYFLTWFGGLNGGSLNDAGGDAVNPGTGSAQGAWTMSRTASNLVTIYNNGLPLPTSQGAGSVNLTDLSIYELARHDTAGATGWVTDQQAYFFMGAGLSSAQVASIYGRLGVMMFALGNSTCATPTFATNYFFDSVAGVDTNDCRTSGTPCQTVARMQALPHYGGGTIQGKGASSFTGCLVLAASKNVTNPAAGPISLVQYSTGAAPILTSSCGAPNQSATVGPKNAAIVFDSIDAIINGWVIRGSGLVSGSATQYGIVLQNSAGARTSNYIVENTDISGFGVVGVTSGDGGADIVAFGFSEAVGFPAACGFMTTSVLNNTLHGSTTTSGENNGFFGTGCNGGQIQQLQGNLIFNISAISNNAQTGNGAYLAQGETGFSGLGQSYIKFTLAHDIGANGTTCGGPVGLWAYQTYLPLLQFDEVYNLKGSGGLPTNACDFSCYDFDIAASFGLAQYLYGHDCGGPGFVVYSGDNGDVVRYSIFENTSSYNEDGGGAFSVGAGSTSGMSWQGYNNSIFQNYSPGTSTPPTCLSLGFGGAYGGGLWANNACFNQVVDTFNRTFMLTGNSASGFNSLTMVNNDYFTSAGGILTFAVNWPGATTYATLALLQAGTTNEVNSKFITTGWTAPPTGTCTWTPSTQATWPPSGCPSAYSTLAAGLKSGVNLLNAYAATWFVAPYPTTEGVRDYYANAINPATSGCRNMGAYGVCP
jgi:hypothetical protein